MAIHDLFSNIGRAMGDLFAPSRIARQQREIDDREREIEDDYEDGEDYPGGRVVLFGTDAYNSDLGDLPIQRLSKTAKIPAFGSRLAAGLDLVADNDDTITLRPGERKLVPTNIAIELPPGSFGMVCSRSGLALKHGVIVLNAPGIIDADYRGSIGVILANLGTATFTVGRGDRIAQLIPMLSASFSDWNEVSKLVASERGEGGFGSTGTAA